MVVFAAAAVAAGSSAVLPLVLLPLMRVLLMVMKLVRKL